MKTEKMSFKNIKDVLSRDEMKGIMAGSGSGSCSASPNCCSQKSCSCPNGGTCSSTDYTATCTCNDGINGSAKCD